MLSLGTLSDTKAIWVGASMESTWRFGKNLLCAGLAKKLAEMVLSLNIFVSVCAEFTG